MPTLQDFAGSLKTGAARVESRTPQPTRELTRQQVAEWFQVDTKTIERWAIPYRRYGHRTVRYTVAEVERWTNRRRDAYQIERTRQFSY